MTERIPRRGDVWVVRFGAGGVGEPTKNRPAVVLSDDALATGSPTDLYVVVPFSASLQGSALRPTISPPADVDIAQESVALVTAVRGIPRDRLLSHIGPLSPDALDRVLAALRVAIGL